MKIFLAQLYNQIEQVISTRNDLARSDSLADVEVLAIRKLQAIQEQIRIFLSLDHQQLKSARSDDIKTIDITDSDAEEFYDSLFGQIPQIEVLVNPKKTWGGLATTTFILQKMLENLRDNMSRIVKHAKDRSSRAEKMAKEKAARDAEAAEKEEKDEREAKLIERLERLELGQQETKAELALTRTELVETKEKLDQSQMQITLYQEKQQQLVEHAGGFMGSLPAGQREAIQRLFAIVLDPDKIAALEKAASKLDSSPEINLSKEILTDTELAELKEKNPARYERFRCGEFLSTAQYTVMVVLVEGLYQPLKNAANSTNGAIAKDSPLTSFDAGAAYIAVYEKVAAMLATLFLNVDQDIATILPLLTKDLLTLDELAESWPGDLKANFMTCKEILKTAVEIDDKLHKLVEPADAFQMFGTAFRRGNYVPKHEDHMKSLYAKFEEAKKAAASVNGASRTKVPH